METSRTASFADVPAARLGGRDDRRARGQPLDSATGHGAAAQTLTDKPCTGSVTSAENAKDTIAMGDLFGGRGQSGQAVSISPINVNSPLFDDGCSGRRSSTCALGSPL
jgi:trimethylamine:corrinoid methyltransferase-like protein